MEIFSKFYVFHYYILFQFAIHFVSHRLKPLIRGSFLSITVISQVLEP